MVAVVAAMLLAQPAGAVPPIGGAITARSGAVQAEQPAFSVTVPSIESEGSSVDEAALRAILNGDIAGHAAQLAALNATRIHIPELTMHFDVPNGTSTSESGDIVYRDIELDNVAGGVASAASIGEIDLAGGDGTSMKFGKMSTGTFDIGGLLGFYGLVPASPEQPLKTVYKDFTFEGGSFSTPQFSCTVGKATTAEFKARPLKVGFMELMSVAEAMQAEGEKPSPQTIAKFVSFYADFFYAFESTPTDFAGLDCSGTTEDGKPLEISIGGITMGGYSAGRYPEFSVSDLKIAAEGDGAISLGKLTFKSVDVSGPVAAIDAAKAELSEDWFATNYRKIIPAFEGFSFSDLDVDVPDGEHPGQRVKAKIGNFDLSLANYVNGIPTRISSTASHVVVPLPADSTDEQVKMLMALGITQVDAGYELSAAWDEASRIIRVDRLSLSGADLGSVAVAATLGHAPDEIFASDPDLAMLAAMGLTVKDIKLDLKDEGLLAIAVKQAAAADGKDEAGYRAATSGMLEGAILAILGSTDEARTLGKAVGDFVGGVSKSVSVTVTANNPEGLSMQTLTAASNDPTVLAGQIKVTGGSE